jgi:hypothetical protein
MAVSRRPLIADVTIHAQVNPCWELWWTEWHWDRLFFEFLGFPLSGSFRHGSVLIYHLGGWTVGPLLAVPHHHEQRRLGVYYKTKRVADLFKVHIKPHVFILKYCVLFKIECSYSVLMHILVSVLRASMDSTSSGVSSNFNASKFSCRRLLLDDFGIGTTPCWICKYISFWEIWHAI